MKKVRRKRSLAFLMALCMIVSSLQIYVNAEDVQAAETSYEYDVDESIEKITASSSKDGHGPELVDDEIYYDDTNNWVPASKPTVNDPQWLLLDFGKVTEVGFMEAGVADGKGPKSYEIQVSKDGESFTTVFSDTVETSRALVAEFNTTSARYMKLVITDSFAEECAINEIIVFEDILPHRIGTLAGVGNLGDFGDEGFESLHEEGVQLVNACVQICDPDHLEHSILPGLADTELFPDGIGIDEVLDYVSNPDNYVWEGADAYFEHFIKEGFDIWLGFQGFNKETLGCLYSDIIDESGRSVEHRDFFNETHNKVVIEVAKQTMAHYDNNPHIRCYSILGPGWFGGIEFYSGSNPELLAVYSDAAQNYFREWLADKYNNIGALNAAWGTSYGDFASVVVPKPMRDNENAVDNRPEWVDLMVWKMEYMDNFVNEYMTTIRSVTDKVIHAEVDGGYQSAPMETGESMGKMIRDFTQYNNVIVGNSNLDSSFGVAQFTSTADFYGAENGATMDDTGQLDEFKHVENAFNFLAYGAGTLAHCHIGNDFAAWDGSNWDTDGDYSGTAMYEWTKSNANKFSLMDPEGSDSDVVIFNPWYSNLFSQDYLTRDYEYVFDAEHGVVWLGAGYANWSHYLDSPNMYDDFPIEDGALTSEGKKVLVVANKDVVLTSDVAEAEIIKWINNGGAFVGFGKDCFNYTYDIDANAVEGGDGVEYWMMGLSGGTAVTEMVGTTVKVSEDAPEWVKSLGIGQTASYVNSDTSQMVAFSELETGVTPVLEDEAGNVIMCEKQVGDGSVLFCTLPIANSAMFKDEFMSTLLGDYADSRNITRTVTYDPEKYHVVDAGVDQNTGKRVIEVTRNDVTTDNDILVIGHDSSLDGVEAIIDLNWKTDSVIYHTFEEGKPFVYGNSIYGEIAGSASIKVNEDGTSEIIVDMGYAYELVSIELDAENKITNVAFADGSAGDAWTITGEAFDGNLTELSDGNKYILSDSELGTVGKIVSDSFIIEDNMLSFYSVGYAGEKASSESVPEEEPEELEDIVIIDFAEGDWSDLQEVNKDVYGEAPVSGNKNWANESGFWSGYYAHSGAINEALSGTLRSKDFVVERETLSFLEAGYCGVTYGPGNWPDYATGGNVFRLVDAETGEVLIEEQPINVFGWNQIDGTKFGDFREHTFDVSEYAGRKVYFEMSDGIEGGYGWFAFTNLKQTGAEVEVVEKLEDIVLVDFAEGDWSDLEAVNEEVYGSEPATGNKNWANESGFWSGYYAHSGAINEALSGTLRSKDFVVERETLSFLEAGYCGVTYGPGNWPDYATGGNVFRLVDAETGEVLIEEQPINVFGWDQIDGTKFGDFREHTFDVSEYAGRKVYFEMSDGIEGGYGWFAFTNLKQTGAEVEAVEKLEDIVLVDFEEGDWSDLQEVNKDVYGEAPVSGNKNWANESGFWSGNYAHSGAINEALSGTLRSKDFVVERETLSFLEAGYCGVTYGPGNWPDYATGGNVFRLVDAETGEVLIEEQPINVFGRDQIDGTKFGDFREHTMDISEYAGRKVYFEMSDGIEGGYGWFAFTNLKMTGAEVEAVEKLEDIVLVDFAEGDWSDLQEVDKDVYGEAPVSGNKNWANESGFWSGNYAHSGAINEALSGKLRSKDFVVERETLSFLEAGYCGVTYGPGNWPDYATGGNVFRLVDAETGEVLIEEQPINVFGRDQIDGTKFGDFREHTMDISEYAGRKVYFEMSDGIEGGYGWFAFTNLKMTGAEVEAEEPEKEPVVADKGYTAVADFECGTWDECVSVDELFGTAPSTSGVTGASGSYACSAAVKESMTGSLKTKTFVIDRPMLTFDGAGWNGQFWEYNTDHGWYLKDAATDEVLMWTMPENRGSMSANFKTYTWDVTEYEGREVYFEMIDALDASGFAWLAVDNVMLVGDKFNAEVVATGYNAYFLKNVKGEILKAAYPKNSEEASLISWDVSDLIGEEVHFEAIDGMDNAENGWFGFGELFSYNYTDAIEDDYWSFESGTYDGWETTGDAFAGVANSDKLGRPLGDDNGKYWADTFANGETATGTLTSMEFEIEKPFISFYTSGWNRVEGGLPYENYYELIDAEGNQLRVATPLRSDPLNTMVRQYWDVSDLIGETVRFRVVDGLAATGYAWIVVDSIRQEYNFNFENGYNGWTTDGEAFGTEPVTSSIVLNQRDSAWADSYLAGSSLTGTLTSDFFTMDSDTINFLSAGYSDGGQNYYRLLNEAGEEIAKAAPTEEEWFSMISMTAAGYAGKKVQLQVVDGSVSAVKGWIAIDDLNFRMATDDGSSSSVFPEQIDIAISMDGENWTESASLAMAGKTKETVDMTGSCARYVRFTLSTDKVDSAFLNYVKINKKVTTVAEDLVAEEGIIDLGSVQTFNSLVADFTNDEVREMTISVSEDGTTWNTVYTAFEAESNPLEVYFTEVSARYVKFEGDVEDLEDVSVYLISTPDGVEDMMPEEKPVNPDKPDDEEPVNMIFTDVPKDAYYYDAVLWALKNDVTYGISDTLFGPNNGCTRAQMVTFLWRAMGEPEAKSDKNPFTDVAKESYYEEAVLWAVENGITKGTTKTTFSPDAECTRVHAVTFLWRAMDKPSAMTLGEKLASTPVVGFFLDLFGVETLTNDKYPFTDIESGSYYEEAVIWAVENGITKGTTKTTFAPNTTCTRAHAVTFLQRTFE